MHRSSLTHHSSQQHIWMVQVCLARALHIHTHSLVTWCVAVARPVAAPDPTPTRLSDLSSPKGERRPAAGPFTTLSCLGGTRLRNESVRGVAER